MKGLTRVMPTNDREIDDYDYWTIDIECKNETAFLELFSYLEKVGAGSMMGCPWDTDEGDNLGDALVIDKSDFFSTKNEWVKFVRKEIKNFKNKYKGEK